MVISLLGWLFFFGFFFITPFLLDYLLPKNTDNIYIHGVVKEHFDDQLISRVKITVFGDGEKTHAQKTDLKGRYKFVLDFGKFYRIEYAKQNYVTKLLTIDAANIPEEDQLGGFEMNIDMTLFENMEGFDFSILEYPIGKAEFDHKKGELIWDMKYTSKRQAKISSLMQKYDEKQKYQED